MSTGKTILVQGGLAAGVLAVVGYFFAQVAGMWLASQSGRGAEAGTADLTATLAWRLPVTMAAFGFALVAAGEGLRSLWTMPPPPKAEPTTPEAELQRLLGEQETLSELERAESMRDRTAV